MKVIHGLTDDRLTVERSVLTVGNFDGVHRGHQRIIALARDRSHPPSVPLVALTFEPHPLSVVTPRQAPQRLSSPAQKLYQLEEAGVDVAVVADSTPEFLALPPEAFIREVVVARFHPTHVVEGRNFGFGRGRRGNVETLQRHAAEFGYKVHVADPVEQSLADGSIERVSSSLIRRLLVEGDVEQAAGALGRPYSLSGTVVAGSQRGKVLGFPTANVASGGLLVPADGVYAGLTEVDDRRFPSAVSIGTTPTFGAEPRRVETYLLDFEGDLYGRTITINFRRRLRAQQRFGSERELVRQIEADVAQVRRESP